MVRDTRIDVRCTGCGDVVSVPVLWSMRPVLCSQYCESLASIVERDTERDIARTCPDCGAVAPAEDLVGTCCNPDPAPCPVCGDELDLLSEAAGAEHVRACKGRAS